MSLLIGVVIGALLGYYFRDTVGMLIEKAKTFSNKTKDTTPSETSDK